MLSTLNKHSKRQLAHCLTSKKISWSATRRSGSFNQIRPSSQDVIFSGIQPTGVPHLGNYLGALQQWVTLQNEATPATQLIFSIVDLHAITVYQDAEWLRKRKRETLATLLAVGLNPERSTIFYQSDVAAHTELMWILSCTASVGYLSRMTQWKSKLALPADSGVGDSGTRAKLKLGLFSYPVLQAADILVYGATHVPVGEDQVQHLEFARHCANGFNAAYGQQVLKQPTTLLSSAKRVMSLQEPKLKMSKSHDDPRSRILVNDSPTAVGEKVRLALTDSTTGVSYDPVGRPGVSNLLALMKHFDRGQRTLEELVQEHSVLSMRDFKIKVADAISDGLADVRTRYNQLMTDSSSTLEDIAVEGANSARSKANQTMKKVRDVIGLQ